MSLRNEVPYYNDETSNRLCTLDSQVLYHYTSPDGLYSILKSHELWFTQTDFLNDTSEGSYIFTIIDSCLKNDFDNGFATAVNRYTQRKQGTLSFIDKFEEFEAEINNEYDKIINKFCDKNVYFSASFSKDEDNLAMWQYYTKSKDGIGYNICLDLDYFKIDLQRLSNFEALYVDYSQYYTVIYDEETQLSIMRSILQKYDYFWKAANSDEEKEVIFEYFIDLIEDIKFVFKHPAFAHENEVKIVFKMSKSNYDAILPLSQNKNSPIKLRQSGGLFIPYIAIPCLDLYSISSIRISPSIKQDNAHGSVMKLLAYCGYEHCSVSKSDIPLR